MVAFDASSPESAKRSFDRIEAQKSKPNQTTATVKSTPTSNSHRTLVSLYTTLNRAQSAKQKA
jgi:hypothetical protein